MAIKTLVAGHMSPREWVGTCPRCKGYFSWEDTDALSITDRAGKPAHSIILCPTPECPSTVTGSVSN